MPSEASKGKNSRKDLGTRFFSTLLTLDPTLSSPRNEQTASAMLRRPLQQTLTSCQHRLLRISPSILISRTSTPISTASHLSNRSLTLQQSIRGLATGLSQTSRHVPTSSLFAPLDNFTRRHVGPQPASVQKMLEYLGYKSMDAFLKDCVPEEIRLEENAIRDEGKGGIWALSEGELLRRAKELGKKNTVTRSFIGLGYHQAVGYHFRRLFVSSRLVSLAEILSFSRFSLK